MIDGGNTIKNLKRGDKFPQKLENYNKVFGTNCKHTGTDNNIGDGMAVSLIIVWASYTMVRRTNDKSILGIITIL
jgi:formate-dependent nitrite reductase cytochrome c552 subunit